MSLNYQLSYHLEMFTMLLLYLSDIKICYMKPIVLLHPFFYFFVCSLCLCTCSIYLIQLNLYLNMIVRFCWDRRTTVSTFAVFGN